MSNQEEKIIGTWKLKKFELKNLTTGISSFPYGDTPVGILIFSKEKYMSVAIMSKDRSPFAIDSLQMGTVEEKTKAIDSFLSYAGIWRVEEDKIFVNVAVSLLPNWTDKEHFRTFQLKDNHLTFATPVIKMGNIDIIIQLDWIKVNN